MNRRSSGKRTYILGAVAYSYMIVAVSLHKTHICVVKSLVKIAAVSWHSLQRFIKPAPSNVAITCFTEIAEVAQRKMP